MYFLIYISFIAVNFSLTNYFFLFERKFEFLLGVFIFLRVYYRKRYIMEVYSLISKYLSGEATIEDKAELSAWRKSDPQNEGEFQELKETWSLAHTDLLFDSSNKEKVWNRIMGNIDRMHPIKMYSRTVLYRTIAVAATVALLIGISIPLLFSGEEENKMVCFKAPLGQKAEVSLPDGTSVFLNSGSVLTYSTDYSRTNRSVKLEGQAFFDVVKDKDHSFDVAVGNVKVVVHGTSFDVNAYKDNAEIAVTLLTGSVSVFSSSSNKLLANLRPNQKAVIPLYDKEKCLLTNCDAQEEVVWRLGKLKIDGEELTDLVRKMERWYGVKVSVNNTNTTKRYWMTVKTESFREMLEIINRITPIEYSINGEEVTITCK